MMNCRPGEHRPVWERGFPGRQDNTTAGEALRLTAHPFLVSPKLDQIRSGDDENNKSGPDKKAKSDLHPDPRGARYRAWPTV
ncbi:MAG: hypothetical protein QOF90_27 [Acetobacteraceae bacterium]|jgi:hypothetical protein|nr:hypothetical protein [Acetobacteraceae bacterium]MEA2774621.1 hypothetical protein [Acetobacteraceae bacterium]MEA2791784.1 hypothetical protein [Acetobacteraceae bacterium]